MIEFCDLVEGGDSLNQTSRVNININIYLTDLGNSQFVPPFSNTGYACI